ncbi:MAG TPA: hypothetical protein PKW44_03030 [Methylophilaceae bacterium]|nr:hypothetical protein [Methylophilaceae bacterium]HQR60701.1 hypothetical protein [Methylophilaceae bacterium]
MKWIAWLLLIANVVLFGYFKLSAPQPVGVVVSQQPIHPEQLRILTPEQLAALPNKSSPPAPAPEPVLQTACYEWASFSGANIARARAALDQFSLDTTVRQTAPHEAARYWVYIPPRKNLEEALAKNDELHAMGINETFVVQEPQWRYAISLGIFKDEKLANRLLDDVRARGVSIAVKGVRNQEKGQSGFFIKNVTASVADEIRKLQPDFPGSELKQVDCQ